MTKPTLHLCDFDGTLIRGDSLLQFLLFSVPLPRLALGGFVLIFQFFAMIVQGKWSNEAGKTAVLAWFYQGKKKEEMEALGALFCQQKLPSLLRMELLASLRLALREGHRVAIVSASADTWLRPFCTAEGFDLLCTELDYIGYDERVTSLPEMPPFVTEKRFSGHLSTPNCSGAEKAHRIHQAYNLDSFEKIVAYGNSKGDAEMFHLADETFKF